MKHKKIFKKKVTVGNNAINKPKLQSNFYEVRTQSRTFYVCSKAEILNNLLQDEVSFEVTFLEYIGFFNGKDDVIRVSRNDSVDYVTIADTDSCYIYHKYMIGNVEKTNWRLSRNYCVEKYYDEFKKLGITLRNDVYARDENFREEVKRQIKSLNSKEVI